MKKGIVLFLILLSWSCDFQAQNNKIKYYHKKNCLFYNNLINERVKFLDTSFYRKEASKICLFEKLLVKEADLTARDEILVSIQKDVEKIIKKKKNFKIFSFLISSDINIEKNIFKKELLDQLINDIENDSSGIFLNLSRIKKIEKVLFLERLSLDFEAYNLLKEIDIIKQELIDLTEEYKYGDKSYIVTISKNYP